MASTGSSSGGGSVVQSENPQFANQAGQIGASAASLASQQYQASTASAINALNQQYAAATSALQPYTITGVNALDQLNQYMGLSPYNPGTAPVNPSTYVPTQSDINNYITQNSHIQTAGGDGKVYTDYTGVGAAYDGWSNTTPGVPGTNPTGMDLIGYNGSLNMGANTGLTSSQLGGITDYLKQQYVEQNTPLYNTEMNAYNQEKGMYDQYSAEGPMTQAQITNKITNQPGFQAEQAQGINAIQNSASAKGLLGSGSMLKDLMNFGQGMEAQYYGQTLSNLATEASAGQGAASGVASLAAQQGNALSNLYTSLGTNEANSTLAGANAQAQAILTQGQEFNVMGQSESSNSSLSGIGSLLGSVGGLASGGGK